MAGMVVAIWMVVSVGGVGANKGGCSWTEGMLTMPR